MKNNKGKTPKNLTYKKKMELLNKAIIGYIKEETVNIEANDMTCELGHMYTV
jgi:hypothetical protein